MTQTIILAAVGQLPKDQAVLHRAAELATTSAAKLHVVHVLDLPGTKPELEDVSTLLGQAALAIRDRVSLALADLGFPAADLTLHVDLGAHALVLLERCKDLDPALIVMRAHQKKNISDKLLGSTTERVIAGGHTPVLVVKRAAKQPYGRVVLATNGADRAAETARFLTRLLPASRLHVVQAVQIPPQLKEGMLRIGTRGADLAAYRKTLTKAAKRHLRALVADSDTQVTTQVLKGDAAKLLTRVSRSRDVDLIAMGQGRASLISRAFIGSVSRRLLRDADCDVLIWSARSVSAA